MHEVGIAQSLIEQVEKKVAELNQPVKALKLSVLLGKLAGVSAEALRFGFEIAKQDSQIPFAQLEIEEVPLRLNCPACQLTFPSEQLKQSCPGCGKDSLKLISGKELQLKTVEYE